MPKGRNRYCYDESMGWRTTSPVQIGRWVAISASQSWPGSSKSREIYQRNVSGCQIVNLAAWEPGLTRQSHVLVKTVLITLRPQSTLTARIQGTRPFSLSTAARAILGMGRWGDDGGKQKLTLQDVAELIRNKECRRVVVMAGAGISTPSGIPDFRSPGSGLYSNLEQYDIPYPEAIFELMYFFVNPKPFFALAKELYPGNYRPNYAHYFLRLLHDKGLLLRLYTQNIDGLERVAGIPPDRLVEAHGTFATATCTVCRRKFPGEDFRVDVMADKVPHCPVCTGVIKPDIVFFGEELPQRFFLHVTDFPMADLLFVIGTSLEVEPFASLAGAVRSSVPRVLINRDLVGPFAWQQRYNDIAQLGDVVSGVKKLVELLDWKEEMQTLIQKEKEKLDAKDK